jgi:hypothetical protein
MSMSSAGGKLTCRLLAIIARMPTAPLRSIPGTAASKPGVAVRESPRARRMGVRVWRDGAVEA